MKSPIALLDFDSVAFAAACVTETVRYNVHGQVFDYKHDANEYCEANSLDKKQITQQVEVRLPSLATSIMRTMTKSIMDAIQLEHAELYLSPDDKSNFRFAVDPTYKANRSKVTKPVNLAACREYAINEMGAIKVSGMEADDIIAIRHTEIGKDSCIVVSIDKDMRQLPGYHYDWRKKGAIEVVTLEEAWYNFYMQLLVGDTVDNIKGCPGIGPKTAVKLLNVARDYEEMFRICMDAYMNYAVKNKLPPDEGVELMRKNAKLLYLLRKRP